MGLWFCVGKIVIWWYGNGKPGSTGGFLGRYGIRRRIVTNTKPPIEERLPKLLPWYYSTVYNIARPPRGEPRTDSKYGHYPGRYRFYGDQCGIKFANTFKYHPMMSYHWCVLLCVCVVVRMCVIMCVCVVWCARYDVLIDQTIQNLIDFSFTFKYQMMWHRLWK